MIRFLLCCTQDHTFDAWFRSSSDFDTQKSKGLLACPVCGDTTIEKALMAPNVGVRSNRRAAHPPPPQPEERREPTAAPLHSGGRLPTEAAHGPGAEAASRLAGMASGLPPKVEQHVLKLAREIRDHVERTAENVGPRFAEEARKIHYEESEARGIYGNATSQEVEDLREEGIEIHPLPVLPEDRN